MFKKDYFKGWYFKCSTNDKTIAFIPAYHRCNNKETASLQIITDDAAFNIPFDVLKYHENPLYVKLGDCIFSEKGIRLNIHTDELTMHGTLRFHQLSPIKYDIMGPFKFIPFMQCRHHVYSMKHQVNGQITINGEKFIFQNGVGYIEGDSGCSFPERYIWTQCNYNDTSLMLSVADIPLFGFYFTGIIGVVLQGKKEYRIATYLGARLKRIEGTGIIIKQGKYRLTAKLIETNAHPLYAPNNGKMDRNIHESASCKASYRFLHKEKPLCDFTSNRASFEFEFH